MIEITKEERVQFFKENHFDSSENALGFTDWQIEFAIENAPFVGHTRYIEYMKHFGFNMFQIRYLIKLFSKK